MSWATTVGLQAAFPPHLTIISLCTVAKWNQMRLSVPPKFPGFFPLLMGFLCLIRPSLLHIQILPHLKSISMLPPSSSLPLSPLIASKTMGFCQNILDGARWQESVSLPLAPGDLYAQGSLEPIACASQTFLLNSELFESRVWFVNTFPIIPHSV